MNAAQEITRELRRRDRRRSFFAAYQYVLEFIGYAVALFFIYVALVVGLSLDVLFPI